MDGLGTGKFGHVRQLTLADFGARNSFAALVACAPYLECLSAHFCDEEDVGDDVGSLFKILQPPGGLALPFLKLTFYEMRWGHRRAFLSDPTCVIPASVTQVKLCLDETRDWEVVSPPSPFPRRFISPTEEMANALIDLLANRARGLTEWTLCIDRGRFGTLSPPRELANHPDLASKLLDLDFLDVDFAGSLDRLNLRGIRSVVHVRLREAFVSRRTFAALANLGGVARDLTLHRCWCLTCLREEDEMLARCPDLLPRSGEAVEFRPPPDGEEAAALLAAAGFRSIRVVMIKHRDPRFGESDKQWRSFWASLELRKDLNLTFGETAEEGTEGC